MSRSLALSLGACAILALAVLLYFTTPTKPKLDPRFGTLEEQESLAVGTAHSDWDPNSPTPKEPTMPTAP
jgi:hypothetical protein